MIKCLYIFLLIFISVYCNFEQHTNHEHEENKYVVDRLKNIQTDKLNSELLIFQENCNDDMACLTMATQDRLGLEAIRALHRQLDDDANGDIDLSESTGFLREELKYENGAEKRQKAFHKNDDMHISVKELWDAWVKSEVHNWTVEQTAEWLTANVELPQYVPTFIHNRVTGAHLPRLATGNGQYVTNVLGIKDPIHKQKIILKAMDVVLFGPPKVDYQNYIKDFILITLLLTALAGCYYAYRQNTRSKSHLNRMIKDMESLQRAELDLTNLQRELERAKQEQEYVTTEKRNLEKRLQEQNADGSDVRSSNSNLELSQLKAEIETLRNALQRAEGELVDRYWSPPPGLQLWLQLTHEIENKSYCKKKTEAEKQLQIARDACEKLRKKRSSLVGAFVSTHGKSIDDVDRSIVDARTALKEVTHELAERVHRWKQIETLCGFNIINNKGFAYLESILYRTSINGRNLGFRGPMSSQDNLDDDTISNYSTPAGMQFADRAHYESGLVQWIETQDTTDSDKVDHDDEEDSSIHSNPVVALIETEDNSRRNMSQSSQHSGGLKEKELLSQSYSTNVPITKPSRLVKSVSDDPDIHFDQESLTKPMKKYYKPM